MNDVVAVLNVQVVTDQPRENTRHVELHFDQPLLKQGELRVVTPGNHALDHIHECTAVTQHILRELFGPDDSGVTQMIITPHHLTLERILAIIREAAHNVGMAYGSSSDSL